jgi:hypothetical protein
MRRTRRLSEYQQLRRCLNVLVPNPESRQLLLHHLERTISETVALREANAKFSDQSTQIPVQKSKDRPTPRLQPTRKKSAARATQ